MTADAGVWASILPPSWAAEWGGQGWFWTLPHLNSITWDTADSSSWEVAQVAYYAAYVCKLILIFSLQQLQ